MANTALLQCYNKGCGNKFKEEDNNEGKVAALLPVWCPLYQYLHPVTTEACTYHPGVPVFHDAMKVGTS